MTTQGRHTHLTTFPTHNLIEKVTSSLQPSRTAPYAQSGMLKNINDPTPDKPALEQPLPPKPERRPRQRNPAPQVPPSTALNHKNDHITHQIERGLIKTKEYKVNDKTNQMLYQHEFEAPYKRGMGEIKLIISGLAEQAEEKITIALASMGDACRDTFVAATALGIKKNSTSKMRNPFKVSVDEILEACGKKRSNGSFNPEARAEVIKHLKTLSQMRIKFSMPTKRPVRRGREWVWEDTDVVVEGPILTHNGTIGEYSRITGKELWEVQDVSLGPWAEFIGGKVKTRLLPQQVLAYSPNNEPYHKKLGHYIHELYRNNAQSMNTNTFKKGIMLHGITMKALFDGATIELPRNRGEFKDAIEKALKHLKQEGIIGHYWYMEKNSSEALDTVENRTGRWFDTYLKLYINFAPTQEILEHYKNIAKKEKDAASEE